MWQNRVHSTPVHDFPKRELRVTGRLRIRPDSISALLRNSVSVGSSAGAGSEIATSADLTNRYINLAVTRFDGNLFDLTILEISRFSDVTIY